MTKLNTVNFSASILFLLTACGGGTTSPSEGNNGETPLIDDLRKELPFELHDVTGSVQFQAAAVGGLGMAFHAISLRRSAPEIEDFILSSINTDNGSAYIELRKRTCLDHGSMTIKTNLPDTPWSSRKVTTKTDLPLRSKSSNDIPESHLKYPYYGSLNPTELKVNANDCYSKDTSPFMSEKFITGSINVDLKDEISGNTLIESSTVKYQNYAIGYNWRLPSTKNLDDSFSTEKKHNILLTGTIKTEGTKDIYQPTGKVRLLHSTEKFTNIVLTHPSGDEFIIENYSYSADIEDGVHAEYTMKWEVTHTPENNQLLTHKFLKQMLPKVNKYAVEYGFLYPKGSYILRYKYDSNPKTGIDLATVDLISHGIKADIVYSDAHADVTYNRNGTITTVRINY